MDVPDGAPVEGPSTWPTITKSPLGYVPRARPVVVKSALGYVAGDVVMDPDPPQQGRAGRASLGHPIARVVGNGLGVVKGGK